MIKILVLFTGGTIGSMKVKTGTVNGVDQYTIGTKSELLKRGIDPGDTMQTLIENYNRVYNIDKSVKFDVYEITDILSENMTIAKWNEITDKIRKIDFSDYYGVIITHGTDTLGYFANYLSLILNDIDIPVMLVSSNYELSNQRANGNYNFQAACDFIKNNSMPGVFASFRNTIVGEQKTRIIYGSRLLQCSSPSNDFESITNKGNIPLAIVDSNGKVDIIDSELYNTVKGKNPYNTGRKSFIYDFNNLNAKILQVDAHVGIDYSNYNLKNINAILHGLYHSGTACTDKDIVNNIIYFNKMAKNYGIDLYAGPFYGKDYDSLYATSSDMISAGIKIVTNTSKENAYVKLMLAYSLASSYGTNSNQVSEFVEMFMKEDINHEFIQQLSKEKVLRK